MPGCALRVGKDRIESGGCQPNFGRIARAVGVMSLYRADGSPPFQGARPPELIADFEAQCVLGDDRLWRFQSHALRPIFVGSDVPISLSIDPRHL
jgi:hypothetical protein